MKRFIKLAGLLMVTACAQVGQEARPVYNVNNEKPRIVAPDPYAQGKIDLQAGQYAHAIEQFRIALKRDPYNGQVLNAIGIAYGGLGRHGIGRSYFERALALAPSAPDTLNNIGWSWLNEGEWKMALVYLERAESRDPTDRQIAANLRFARGRKAVYERLSDLRNLSDASALIRPESATTKVLRLPVRAQSSISAGGYRNTAGSASTETLAFAPSEHRVVDESDHSDKGRVSTIAYTIINGTGRRGMAARLRDYLISRGFVVQGLKNADHFSYGTSAILYPHDRKFNVEELAAALPSPIEMIDDGATNQTISLRLGKDLLEFDEGLITMIGKMKGNYYEHG